MYDQPRSKAVRSEWIEREFNQKPKHAPVAAVEELSEQATDEAPPELIAAPARRSRFPLYVGAVVMSVAILGGAGYAAYTAVLARTAPLAQMLPSDSDVYISVNLDPSIGQKLALLNLAHKFPKTTTDADLKREVENQLDTGFKDVGLSFKNDVEPWLGAEVAFAGRLDGMTPSPKGPAVFLLASHDDKAALAAMEKMRRYKGVTWTSEKHGGVEVWSSDNGAMAYLNKAMAFGSSVVAVESLIDVAHGGRSKLSEHTDFQKAIAKLPKERLVEGYLNLPSLGSRLQELLTPGQTASTNLAASSTTNPLAGIGPAGFDVVAGSDSITAEFLGSYDFANLSDGQRKLLSSTSHLATTLKAVPAGAVGLIAVDGLRQSLQDVLAGSGSACTCVKGFLHQFGLDDPNSAAAHLGDGAALEVEAGDGKTPAGALLVSTTDRAGTQKLLDAIVGPLAAALAPPPPKKGKAPASPLIKQTYKGVAISSLNLAGLPAGVSPAYAVTDDLAIVASSVQEVKTVIDTAMGSGGLITTSAWRSVTGGDLTGLRSALYLDVSKIADLVSANLKPDERKTYTSDVAPYLKPFKTFYESSNGDASHYTSKIRLVLR